MNIIARDPQIFRRRQPAGTTADDADRLSAWRADFNGLDPTLFPCGIGDIFLDRADGDGIMTRKFDDAIAFAQPVLRTDAAADFGHRAGQVGQFISLAQTPFGGQAEPVGDVVVQRAMDRAIRHPALRAARGLVGGGFGGVAVGDFVKILGTQLGRALFRIGLRLGYEFQHGVFGHDALLYIASRIDRSTRAVTCKASK